MEKSTDKLREAYRTAMDTETVGAQVMQDLHEQRQTLERSRGRLSKAGTGLARTSRVLKTMGRRALANKLLLWFMIAFLLLMMITDYDAANSGTDHAFLTWGWRVPFLLSVKSNCQPFDLLGQILDGTPLLDVHQAQMIDLAVCPFQRLA